MVRFERVGGASGVIGVAAIATQFVVAGTGAPDAVALLQHRFRWEWATFLRAVGGLGIIWFTASLAARLRRWESPVAGPAVWLFSAFFNSASIFLAADYSDASPPRTRSP